MNEKSITTVKLAANKPSQSLPRAPWYWTDGNLFEDLPPAAESHFFSIAKRESFKRKQKVFDIHDVARCAYYLHEGLVKIYNLSSRGDIVIFWLCGPGSLFGAGAIGGSSTQCVAAQTVQSSQISSIPRAEFEHFIETYPRAGINVITMLSARLRQACDTNVYRINANRSVRLARLLLQLINTHRGLSKSYLADADCAAELPVTQQDLADMMGVGRQTANCALADLGALGLTKTHRGGIMILSLNRLLEFYRSSGEDRTSFC